MYVRLVRFIDLLRFGHCNHFLFLVKRFDLEVIFEFKYFFCFAFPLGSFGQFLFEVFVDALEIFYFLLSCHEKDVGELRVFLAELLPHLDRQ